MKNLEMWAGFESSIIRSNDSYVDQSELNGHYSRQDDIKFFNELGVKKLRYPCLWERVAPKDLDHCNWNELDEKLGEFKRLKQEIMVGFLHHGSGPIYTSLIDPDFPEKFATYARLFATRYPWINDFSPIHEINKTALNSCLYGHWYPHLTNDTYYLKALLYQCRATILAMKEIRVINPKARLIQTEMLGEVQSTEELREHKEFENRRRWLALDLLSGKVTPTHPLYSYFIDAGIRDAELLWFSENPCVPDIIGVSHYHDSNRFYDERMNLYPTSFHKKNFADLNAEDIGEAEVITQEEILEKAWERYHIPLAITEGQSSGEIESKMRWLYENWQTANHLRQKGIYIEAVTAWSLLGSYGRENFYTSTQGLYEPGIFSLRPFDQKLVQTRLSRLVTELAQTGISSSPILASEGIWKNSRRIHWAPQVGDFCRTYHSSDSSPVLIMGATKVLGLAIATNCGARNINYKLMRPKEMDLSDVDTLEQAIEIFRPWAVIYAGNYIESEKSRRGLIQLARLCDDYSVRLLYFSENDQSKATDLQLEIMNASPDTLMLEVNNLQALFDEELVNNDIHLVSRHTVTSMAKVTLNLLINEIQGRVVVSKDAEDFQVLEQSFMPETQISRIAPSEVVTSLEGVL